MHSKATRMLRRTLAVLLTGFVFAGYTPALLAANNSNVYVHEEFFPSDYSMTGLFDSTAFTFYSGEWELHEAALTLCFSVTPLVHFEVSSFSLLLNGERFYSSRLPQTTGQAQQVEIPIPLNLILSGSNRLEIESYIRTNDSEACTDDISTASWMTIFRDTSVSVSYTPSAQINGVAECFNQLTSVDALENSQSAVFVNAGADDTELTAAAMVLSGISANASLYYNNIAFSPVNEITPLLEKKYGIYISRFDGLLPSVRKLLTDEQVQAVQGGEAVVALVKPQSDCNLLVVTASDQKAVLNAARMFANQAYMLQVKAPWRMVSATENVTYAYDTGKATKKLTEYGSYLHGPFRQEAQFFIESFPNRVLRSGSAVRLAYRYAENLDFSRSLMTVYINDTPIGSKKLSKDYAKADSASFYIPADLAIKGNFVVRVAFDLELADLACTLRQDEMPWAFVSAESTITVISADTSAYLFEYYPYPFVKDGRMNNVAFILPGQPEAADYEAMRSVLLTLGRYQKENTGILQVMHASNIKNLRESNVIAIGRLAQNPIAQQINNQLFFQFSPEGTTIRSNEKMLIEPNYGASLGSAQLVYSPYSVQRLALLLISGVTDAGMLKAAGYLGSADNIWKVAGDGFVADSDTVYYYRFKADNAQTTLPGLSQTELWPLAVIGMCVLALLVISAVLLWRKHRRRAR